MIEEAIRLLRRYREETPLGHQPHMIAHEADQLLWQAGVIERPEDELVLLRLRIRELEAALFEAVEMIEEAARDGGYSVSAHRDLLALAAATGTAKTAKLVEGEAPQSGGEAVTPNISISNPTETGE